MCIVNDVFVDTSHVDYTAVVNERLKDCDLKLKSKAWCHPSGVCSTGVHTTGVHAVTRHPGSAMCDAEVPSVCVKSELGLKGMLCGGDSRDVLCLSAEVGGGCDGDDGDDGNDGDSECACAAGGGDSSNSIRVEWCCGAYIPHCVINSGDGCSMILPLQFQMPVELPGCSHSSFRVHDPAKGIEQCVSRICSSNVLLNNHWVMSGVVSFVLHCITYFTSCFMVHPISSSVTHSSCMCEDIGNVCDGGAEVCGLIGGAFVHRDCDVPQTDSGGTSSSSYVCTSSHTMCTAINYGENGLLSQVCLEEFLSVVIGPVAYNAFPIPVLWNDDLSRNLCCTRTI